MAAKMNGEKDGPPRALSSWSQLFISFVVSVSVEIDDVNVVLPGALAAIQHWFIHYREAEGKRTNIVAGADYMTANDGTTIASEQQHGEGNAHHAAHARGTCTWLSSHISCVVHLSAWRLINTGHNAWHK